MENKIRTITYFSKEEIVSAITSRETFEVIGSGGDSSGSAEFVKKFIDNYGFTCRIKTKRSAAAFTRLFSGFGKAGKDHTTHVPDFEIEKRPGGTLLVSYVKTPSTFSQLASGAADSVAETWDKYAPSKERIVGTFVAGPGALALNKEELEAVGARTISATSKTASIVSDVVIIGATAVSDTAITAATAISSSTVTAAKSVRDHPFATVAGAVIGVGAVAAAPFTGGGSVFGAATLASSLAGAGTVAAAIGAGAAGAGACATISNAETNKIKTIALEKGVENEKAESAVKIEELSKMMVHAAEVYTQQARANEFVIALAAIGLSMAACDGSISNEENVCVEEYVIGMSRLVLPQIIRDRLHKITNAPPDFERAILYVENFDNDIWPIIDGLLEIIGEADGDINQSKQEFLDKWKSYKATALEEESNNG